MLKSKQKAKELSATKGGEVTVKKAKNRCYFVCKPLN